jgi:PmbA protein
MSNALDLKRLEAIAGDLVADALRRGADAADVVIARGEALAVEVREGKVEETERSEADDLALRVFVGRRSASVSTNSTDKVAGLAERAVAMARHAPEDPYAGLAEAGDLARTFADLDLDLVDRAEPTADALAEAALALEAAALAVQGVSRSGGAGASWSRAGLVLATSSGFVGAYIGSRHGRWATAVAGEGTGMERDYWSSSAIHIDDLEPLDRIGRTAGERAVRRLAPRKVETGTGTVVFEPRAAASLVGHLAGAANGAAIARGTSVLKDRLGSRVFSPGLRISDDPTRRRGLASRPFDGEGVAGAPLALVEDGVLTTWLLDSATARELKLRTNGRAARGAGAPSPGATNLTLEAGGSTPEALIAAVGTGLYVTDLIGHGANIVTGDYSRGASGFWIENGEIAYPVSELTIASTLPEMFARLVAANDLEYRFSVNAPTVAVEGMTIAGR